MYRVLMHKRRLALLISHIPVILLGVDVQGVVVLQREGGGGERGRNVEGCMGQEVYRRGGTVGE